MITHWIVSVILHFFRQDCSSSLSANRCEWNQPSDPLNWCTCWYSWVRYYNYLIIHGHGHRCADLVYLFVYVTWTMTWNRYSFRPLLLHKFMRCIHRHCCGHFHRRYCPFSIHFVSWSYAISLVIFVGFFRWEISLYFIIFKHTTKLPKYMYLWLVLSSSVWSVQFYSVLPNHLIQFIFAHCLWCF